MNTPHEIEEIIAKVPQPIEEVLVRLLGRDGILHRPFTASLTFADSAAREWSSLGLTAYIVKHWKIIAFYRDGQSVKLPEIDSELAIRCEVIREMKDV